TETLFESELFGHEKGAFTGATSRKLGLVETAQGGTLFLDEIGDVPLSMQVKLLRLIESGTYRRVGSVEIQHATFRLVAATHKALDRMMEQREFRQDLYYRI
ncbi:sigma 54-interacting transcriptional regulator, partial [Sphingomonas sp. 10B4]